MASDSSSSTSSSGTEFADPILSTDPETNSERVVSQLESMNLSEPREVAGGSHTVGGDSDDAAVEVASSNGNEDGVRNGCLIREGLAEISGEEASSTADHPVELEAYEDADDAAVEDASCNGNEGGDRNECLVREDQAEISGEEVAEASSMEAPVELEAYEGGGDNETAVEDASSNVNEGGVRNECLVREGLGEINVEEEIEVGEASSSADHPIEIEAYEGGHDEAAVEDPSSNECGLSNGGSLHEVLAGTSIEVEREEGEASSRTDHPVEMEAGEEPPSPTSSGYDGERGSSGGATSTYKADYASENEIREANVDDDTASQHEAAWLPGKRHVNEDDASISWRKRKKHFFILSNSGKPIYSRYGDEHKLAGFSATLQAIISFVENGGDRVNLVKAGKHQVVFLVKGPIYLVCISCTDETYEYLKGQLDLLYGQMILILTKSIDKCFEKNAKFDMTPLLGGTDAVFSSLVHSFSWNPATFLHAYTCLPLPYELRQAVGTVLQDVCASGVLFALLMCRHKVISLAGAQKNALHPDDLLLLSNFVMSSESFRTSESFSPICLPRYNPSAFLHAYVHFFDDDTYLMLLTTRLDAFYHLKDCRIRIEAVLLKSNILSIVQRSIFEGGLRVEDLPIDRRLRENPSSTPSPNRLRDVSAGTGGPFGIWHFMYRSIYLDQYVSSEFSPPVTTHRQQKSLYRAYQKIYASMHEKGLGPHKTQYRRDENYTLLCWVTPDFELYAAFDPLADKEMAIKICNQVCQRVKDVENEVFLQGASPFSW